MTKGELRKLRKAGLIPRVPNAPTPKPKPKQQPTKRRYATREEQHARYIDCGPSAWDDR